MITNHNQINNQKSLFIIAVSLLCSCTFIGCSTYQQHLGGTGHNYQDVQNTHTLQTTNTKFPIIKSDRYKVPNIPGTWSGPIKDVSPPDYANPIESNKSEINSTEKMETAEEKPAKVKSEKSKSKKVTKKK